MRFELEPYHRNTADAELIEDLRRVAAELGAETVTRDAYNERGRFSAMTQHRHFGNWNKALELAGLKTTHRMNIPEENLFENLVEVWTQLGRQPRYKDLMTDTSSYGARTYVNRFGTWRQALEAFIAWANEGAAPAANSIAQKVGRRTPRVANWRQRAIVLMRDSAKCRLCAASPQSGARLHVDHIVPWSRGGETVIENLQVLCEQCNIGKSNIDAP
jgi:Homing endonuclease associated repeat/HNH endonuclease